MVQVIPSILTNDPQEAREMLERLEGVERAHIDIVDGQFANNKTVEPMVFGTVEGGIALDYHLMVKEPVDWVEKTFRGGADRIISQVEKMSDQNAYLAKVTEVGTRVGLALDLETQVNVISLEVLRSLDVVLVMGVKAGHGGQEFETSVLRKVEELDRMRRKDETPFKICVDGGVNGANIGKIVKAGADEVVIGRRLFEGDVLTNIQKLKGGINGE